MPQTALPNLGLDYNYDLGQDGWAAGMDDNLALLDNLAQAVITIPISSVSAQPGGPVNGESHIIGSSPVTGADWAMSPEPVGWFAVWYTNTGWHFAEPREGWTVFDQDSNQFYTWDGSAWIPSGRFIFPEVTIFSGSPVAYEPQLSDANSVMVVDMGSPPTQFGFNIPDNATVPFPIGATLTFANQNGEIVVTDDGAVSYIGTDPTTINSPEGLIPIGALLKIQKVDTDLWLVLINGVA